MRVLAFAVLLGLAASAYAVKVVEQYAQCGGKSNCNKYCDGGAWLDVRCPTGWDCVNNDPWYHNCQPGGRAQTTGHGAAQAGPGAANSGAYKIPPPEAAQKTSTGDYNYGQVMKLSLMFYEAQRAGKLPSNNRIKWRRDSGVLDRTSDGRDVSKGWYDAGDNVKFNLPMAWSVSALALGVYDFWKGYQKANQLNEVLNQIKWVTDYFMECVGDGTSIVVQVGNGQQDHAMWDRPESYTTPKPVYVVTPDSPGSDAVGAMAAALAATSTLFWKRDPDYSQKLLDSAVTAFNFAVKYQGKYSDSVQDAASFYRSSNYYDDLAWAAGWLAIRTGSDGYKNQAKQLYDKFLEVEDGGVPVWNNYDWDSNSWGAAVLMTRLFPNFETPKRKLLGFVDAWTNGKDIVSFTPQGIAFSGDWGSLRHVGNALLLMNSFAFTAGNNALTSKINCFTHQQLRLILGDAGRSFVVGYGKNPPQQAHHRAASCPPMPDACSWDAFNNPGPNWHTLYGALVGGPNGAGGYEDQRNNFVQNEVATDYNAGFTGALAAVLQSGTSYRTCRGELPAAVESGK